MALTYIYIYIYIYIYNFMFSLKMALKSLNGVAESCKLKKLNKSCVRIYLINCCTKFYVPSSSGL